MLTAICPECKANISISVEPYIGQGLTCAACSTRLEIVWLFPLSLSYPEDDLYNSPPVSQLGGETNPIAS